MGKIFRIFWRDLKRILRNPVAVIVTLGVCVIPSLYAWFNILANWDPYENTQDVRVAVVNLDEGADAGGDLGFINAGDMVVEELGKNTQLKWVFLDEDTALEEVRAGRSYAAIVIPADFTKDLTSVLTGDLVSPDLTYYVNEKVNPIAPKVTDTGASTVETQINETFVSTVTNVVVGKLQDVAVSAKGDTDNAATSIVSRVRGVKGTVDDLSSSMTDAQGTVSAARETIADAEATLDELDRISSRASGSLADATGVLFTSRDDATSLATSVSGAVADGSTRLSSISGTTNQAIGRISGKIGQAQGTAEGALATAQSLVDQNRQLVQELEGLSSSLPESARPAFDAAVAKISEQVDKEQTTVDKLSRATSDIGATNDAVAGLSSSVNDSIQTGTSSLSGVSSSFNQTTLPQLYGALDSFSGAAQSLSGSLGGLSPTISQTKAVLEQLDDTLEQTSTALDVTTQSLGEMSGTLDKVATDLSAIQSSSAMDRVSELLDLDANGIASFMSSPVALDEEAIFPVANYGSGVAPFYTNLALWVGGFVLIAIYKAEVDDEGIDGGFEPWQGYFGRLLLFLLLGVLQGVICTVGDLVIGIQCLDPKAFVLAGVIESFVYVNVIFAFAVAFKHIGKALCVLLVILQIPGSSGTYPIEMMPGFPHRDDAGLLPRPQPLAAIHLRHPRHARGHRRLLRQLLRPQPLHAPALPDPCAAHRRGLEAPPPEHQLALRQEACRDRPHDLRARRHRGRALPALLAHQGAHAQRRVPHPAAPARSQVQRCLPAPHSRRLRAAAGASARSLGGHVLRKQQAPVVHRVDRLPGTPVHGAHHHRVLPRVAHPKDRHGRPHQGRDVPAPGGPARPRVLLLAHRAAAPTHEQRRGGGAGEKVAS